MPRTSSISGSRTAGRRVELLKRVEMRLRATGAAQVTIRERETIMRRPELWRHSTAR
jgi:hypothetical protein